MATAATERELILDRMAVVLAAVPAVTRFQRNDAEIPENKLPAVILLDGDESSDERAFRRNRPANGPNLIAMTPEVHIVVQENAEDIGPTLNGLRDDIISALREDSTLLGLIFNNEIRYEGCSTDLAAGRAMAGAMGLSFHLTYVHR